MVLEVAIVTVDGYNRYEKIGQERHENQQEAQVEVLVPPTPGENAVASATTFHLSRWLARCYSARHGHGHNTCTGSDRIGAMSFH